MTVDFQRLQSDISDCRSLLLSIQAQLSNQSTVVDTLPESFLNVKQAAELLDIAPQTIYQRVKDIPHIKKFGRLYFLKSELITYLKQG